MMCKKCFYIIGIIVLCNNANLRAQSVEEVFNEFHQSCIAGDYTQAFAIAQKELQEKKSLLYGIILGEFYMNGLGTEQDLREAYRLFCWASTIDKGMVLNDEVRILMGYACRMSAIVLAAMDNGFDEDRVIMQYRKAIEISGDAFSACMLGQYYITEYPTNSKEYEDGLELMKKAASQNSITALSVLGDISMENGEKNKAAEYWMRAASIATGKVEKTDFLSMCSNPNVTFMKPEVIKDEVKYKLAKLYTDRDDYESALIWLERLSTENPEYLILKGRCYADIDKEKSLQAFQRSLELKEDSKVYHLIGILYKELWADEEKSREYLKKAILMGNEAAMETYQEMYGN